MLSRALLGVWLVVLVLAAYVLVTRPSSEIYAVELVVLSFALLYGFAVWPVAPTVLSIVGFVVLAALVMYPRAGDGDLPSAELIEVVVPVALAASVIYHVRRREQAIGRANRLTEVERRRAAGRERLSRMTSHELRTPLTVATGYVDHLLDSEQDDARREDLLTVRDELDQLARVTDRLVRAVALDLGAPDRGTDVRALLLDLRRRWEVVVERDLVVDCSVDTVPIDAERLRAALDTLIENSVRYTGEGDLIRLFATRTGDGIAVGVADSGPGLSPELAARINADADHGLDAEGSDVDPGSEATERLRDTYSQTGFGLRIVAAIARTAGGRLVASRAPEGGAWLALALATGAGSSSGAQRTTSVNGTVWTTDPDVAVRSSW